MFIDTRPSITLALLTNTGLDWLEEKRVTDNSDASNTALRAGVSAKTPEPVKHAVGAWNFKSASPPPKSSRT
jgi:hypothetical protein